MPKTNTEKIDELSSAVAILNERVDALEEAAAAFADTPIQVAILEHRVNHLEKTADRWLLIRDKLLFLVIGAVITLIVKHIWP